MKRDVLNSPRLLELKKERRKIFLRKIFLYLFGGVAIFFLLAYISRTSVFNISSVQVVGNKVTESEMIKAAAEGVMAGNYLWIFPKTNILFYPKGEIKNELRAKFERLKDINLFVKNKKELEITVTEREGVYMWCGEVLREVEAGKEECYFLDTDGYIFDVAPYFSGEVYFKFYGEVDVNENNPLGFYFSQVNFAKVISLKKSLETMGLKPVASYIMDDENIKVFLQRGDSLSLGPEIILKTDSDFEKAAENLQAALTTEPLRSSFKNKYSSLLYIDLRFGNKVYYKFK